MGFGRFRLILQKILRAQARVVNWRQMNGYFWSFHFKGLDTGVAGNLDIQILGRIILQESTKTWDFGPIEI